MKSRMKMLGMRIMAAALLLCGALFSFGGIKTQAALTPVILQFVQSESDANSMTVAWQVSNTDLIEVWYRESLPANKNQFTRVAVVTGNSYTLRNLKGGTGYDVEIVAISGTGKDARSAIKVLYNVGTRMGDLERIYQISWDRFEKKLEVGWDKLPLADGYEYYFETANETKKLENDFVGKDVNSKTFLINNNQAYKFSVRAFVLKNGVKTFTPWKSIICLEQPWVKKAVKKGKKLTVTWKKVRQADGYDVYVSATPNKGYKKVKSVSAKTNSVTIKKVGKKKIKSKKKWYVYVVAKKDGNTSGARYYFPTATGGSQYIAFK